MPSPLVELENIKGGSTGYSRKGYLSNLLCSIRSPKGKKMNQHLDLAQESKIAMNLKYINKVTLLSKSKN